MSGKQVQYYLICGCIVAKREIHENTYTDLIFQNGKWAIDVDFVIADHLNGFDPSEPEDSPYRFGNTSILMEMDKISESKAIQLINDQIIAVLKEKWKREFKVQKEEWDEKPQWPAKLVKTSFTLNHTNYRLLPSDLGLSDDCWDQGFMESIQPDIGHDLKEYGATNIVHCGFLD